MLRSWLKKRGKQHCIDFDDEELRQLRNYFNSLDDDGSGAIGVDELEDPLIALGLVENRQQVASIVAMVDEDGSQQIEFDEFLSIIKGGNTKTSGSQKEESVPSPTKKKQTEIVEAPKETVSGSQAIFDFFKKLTSGELKVDSEDKIIPFSIFISTYRRKKILDAMMGKTPKEREEGTRILNNYKKQLAERMAR
jgi:EF-hand domain pair